MNGEEISNWGAGGWLMRWLSEWLETPHDGKFNRKQGQWHSVDQPTIQELYSTGRHQECLQACQQLLQNEPETPSPGSMQVNHSSPWGNLTKLSSAYKSPTARHQRPEITKDIGNIFLNLGDKDAASQWYEKSLSINNNYAPAINNLANLMRQGRNNQEVLIYSSEPYRQTHSLSRHT